MAIIKCKMCGGDLALLEGASTAECEYCGSVQTVPKVDDEKKLTLFARANRLRISCEFDKAAGIYESIVADFPEEAEAYWGLVLCKFGIEYVDDPATGKKIPTCHRSSFDSILDDSDFEQALENADPAARRVYRDEAKAIEELRKGIIAVSANEQPYDIFICYKETAEDGQRTLDSVLAQDVYDALTDKGYRVFFSRITLEDKLGVEYEPYIFAALNSAKVMLTFGTDYEYFNAVWVKNEWSRFLKLMAQDKEKHLIPCYKGIDAYDMPKEFAKLQAQDLGKVGATQDLLRGIEKLLPLQTETVKETVVVQQAAAGSNPTVDSYLERAFMFLEDGDWESAREYCEKVLDIAPKNAKAYLGKLLADLRVKTQGELCNQAELFDGNVNYQKALRFADPEVREILERSIAAINKRKEEERIAREKREEEDRIARKKREEIARIGRERREEEERIALEKQKERLLSIRNNLRNAQGLLLANGWFSVGLKADGIVAATGENHSGQCNVRAWRNIVAVSCSDSHTVGLKADGTVVATGNNYSGQCNVSDWREIVAVSCGFDLTVGLKADGTVVATGSNTFGQCNVSNWKDILAVSCSFWHTVGLKADGTVVATGDNKDGRCNVSAWRDIVTVSCTRYHTVGLKADGTVVATGNNEDGQCNVSQWRDIVAVSCGDKHTVGLKADGAVVATGDNKDGRCNVSAWRDIVTVCCSENHTVGLKADGTVVATGNNFNGECNVSDWREIVAVSCGSFHTVGLKSDGTVVATGSNTFGQCNVSDWKLFDNYETVEKERIRHREVQMAWKSAGKCLFCGGEFKGLFSKKCVSCGRSKDY